MTTYSFVPNRVNGVTGTYPWDDPANWSTNSVPMDASADVIIPTITRTSDGTVVSSTIELAGTSNFTIRSLTIGDNTLKMSLPFVSTSITGRLTIQTGGTVTLNTVSLFVGSLSNSGVINGLGSITSASAVTNSGTIQGTQYLQVPSGSFTNFSGGTLTGGSYDGVDFSVGGPIVTDAANLTNNIYSNLPDGTFVPLQSSLRTIAAAGTLTINAAWSNRYTTSNLTVDGTLVSNDIPNDIIFAAQQLTIASTGTMIANGEIVGAVEDDGLIKLAPTVPANAGNSNNPASDLLINGPVTGSGTIEITPAVPYDGYRFYPPELLSPTVELNGPASAAVVFDDPFGELKLDQPTAFTGTIAPNGTGDAIALSGIALGDVTGVSYSGDANGGTLTIDEAGSAINLRFVGDYTAANFVLTPGPQPYSTSPPNLLVTVTQQPGDAFAVDGSQGPQSIVGTGSTNFINTINAAGGSGTVDLANGDVTGTGFLARLTNIQGLQLGAGYWTVFGLRSGTDLIYGGSGTLNFTGQGASDVIQGGTGTNLVYGGTGDEIFYSNGGNDTMLGGSGANFMQAGATSSSTDVFNGNGGTDFIYGGAGTTTVIGGGGTETFYAGTGNNEMIGLNHLDAANHTGTNILHGGSGTDLFYAGIGTNLLYEGSGTDILAGNTGTDYIYGGSGRSFIYGSTGIDVITTGAGPQYVRAGSGYTVFNDTAANLTAGRLDRIDNFAGGQSTDLYMPTAVQGTTTFVQQDGGTAVLTAVNGGTAEIFAGGADLATVQAHTHFTL